MHLSDTFIQGVHVMSSLGITPVTELHGFINSRKDDSHVKMIFTSSCPVVTNDWSESADINCTVGPSVIKVGLLALRLDADRLCLTFMRSRLRSCCL